MMTLSQQIEQLQREHAKTKPRSDRRRVLEHRMVVLRLKQMRQEIRTEKKSAA